MKQLVIAAAAIALSGCTGHAAREQLDIRNPSVAHGGFGTPQDTAAGAAVKAWTDTYTPIKRRRAALDALQKRLDRLGEKKDSYAGAKAQCWIETGNASFAARDEWGFVEESIGEATELIEGLESGRTSGANSGNFRTTATRPLRTAAQVRPDLWAQLAALRADARFAGCAPAQKPVACAEVELTRAGHDAWTHAFVAAQQRVDSLQAQVRDASQALTACAVVPPLAAEPEVISLYADALFEFGRGDLTAIRDEGRRQLDQIAVRLRALDAIDRLVVSGYTDRLGSAEYNLHLSWLRADTVRRYLADNGVNVPIDVRALGKAQPGSACAMRERAELIDCLARDRRVEIRVVGAQRKRA
ncbi:OmpA family protein [Paraburkholderia rhizosphaerae]|uniref:Outer membrane protein OmpA-like peptidoglycan-associated protein n=1 Tax=Paraburkholderia rhizosphaerae TaxID=480658 RepID=A0A4R8LK24_9BURK|nr:OmpA family protein [Paraburkholderia rhizosphaerae]TDY42680.1 outer membrane protein OmpA-like peptidoglycan-associated protein [Paraburkholderia rhizosphaerae]